MDSIHLDSNLGHWMTHRPQPKENPFRIGGVVSGPFFADREDERKRIRQALVTPQEHLLVYGPRRMGKTSMLRVVQETLRHGGHPVILADLSTASSLSEMTTRLLQAATRELGRKWRDVAAAFAERLRIKLTLEPDPATGLLLPSLGVGLADADVGAQRQTFGDVLDAIDALASARRVHLGVVLDEFQEIHRFGGETAEAHLRGIIQHHEHASYVLAGSDQRLIEAMISKSRPFYKLLTPMRVGAIPPERFAPWIEERFATVGLSADGAGPAIIEAAGPRTRDVVQLAHEIADMRHDAKRVTAESIETAFTAIVRASDAPYRAIWYGLTALQQQVLRVLAVRSTGLTTTAVRRDFALTAASGSLAKTAQTLASQGVLTAADGAYRYDDPFMRGWVILNALPDIGRTLPVVHAP